MSAAPRPPRHRCLAARWLRFWLRTCSRLGWRRPCRSSCVRKSALRAAAIPPRWKPTFRCRWEIGKQREGGSLRPCRAGSAAWAEVAATPPLGGWLRARGRVCKKGCRVFWIWVRPVDSWERGRNRERSRASGRFPWAKGLAAVLPSYVTTPLPAVTPSLKKDGGTAGGKIRRLACGRCSVD